MLTIQEVAEITGLSGHTLRYYERIGLIYPIDRTHNNHRRYSTDDVGWIEFLMKLRATGMSIQQMQEYAHLQREGDDTLPERVEILKHAREELRINMEALQEHMKLLNFKIRIYEEIISDNAPESIGVSE